MTKPYEPTKPKTKSERIKELLGAGLSSQEVAEKLNTTVDYVYKEKGKLRKKGLLVTEQSITIAKEGNRLTVVKGQGVDSNSNNSPPSGEDRTYGTSNGLPVQRDDLKSLYSCFEKNMDASEVIALHGISPDISEKEYNRFLSIKSRDPFEFQDRLISELESAPSELQSAPEIRSLIEKSHGTLLTNDELLSIIIFKTAVYALKYLQLAVSNPAIQTPGLNRFVCRFCGSLQPGVLFDVGSYSGKFLQAMASGHVCSNCSKIKNEAYEEFKRTPS